MFEDTKLFLRGIGDTTDVVAKEMYTFEDRGGRSITLRAGEHRSRASGPILNINCMGISRYISYFTLDQCSGMIVRRQGDIENSTSLEWKFLEDIVPSSRCGSNKPRLYAV